MPKRIPTPPPADDEPRYLTVVHPYAIDGTCNMELTKDRQDFARWVACCINKDAFFAIFHKPSSRGMVIIEIQRDYPHFDRILGEHRWSEFLQEPTKEEEGRATQVFYCTYNSGRIVQKNGWKRIDVDDAWFKGCSPNNRKITYPYPPTHFCDVPAEDRTNHFLCRPLPGVVKAPPVEVIAAPQPVVGSTAWTKTKEGGQPPASITTQAKPNAPGTWAQGAPKIQATSAKPNPTGNGSAKKTISIPQGPHTGTRMPAVGGGSIAVKASNVWQNTGKKAPVATNWDESAPVSRQSTPVSSAILPATAPTALPKLPAKRNAWEDEPNHPPGITVPDKAGTVLGADRSGSLSAASWGSVGASTSSPDSDSGPDLTTATESDNPYSVHIHFSESMEEEFHGMGIKGIADDDDDDDDELRELDSIAPGAWGGPVGDAAWEMTAGWEDNALDAEDQWRQNQEITAEPDLCKAHGVICKKGICVEYAKQVRAAKRAKEEEERKAAAANKGKKGRKGRGSKRNDGDENENRNESSGRNAAQNNNPFRGPGASVKTNWRGAPRAIVSADTIEKRETTKADSDDGWGDSDSDVEPNASAVAPARAADAASDASWGISENAYDPWAGTAQPAVKANRSGGRPPRGGKKPGQTRVATSWADQVDAELGAGNGTGMFTTAGSKRGSKRGSSTTSWGTSTAKSSASGWGKVPDMPW